MIKELMNRILYLLKYLFGPFSSFYHNDTTLEYLKELRREEPMFKSYTQTTTYTPSPINRDNRRIAACLIWSVYEYLVALDSREIFKLDAQKALGYLTEASMHYEQKNYERAIQEATYGIKILEHTLMLPDLSLLPKVIHRSV